MFIWAEKEPMFRERIAEEMNPIDEKMFEVALAGRYYLGH